jgi:hypothetical protein
MSQQREVQYIALCVGASDAMGLRRQAGQQAYRAGVFAAAERDQRGARRQPNAPRRMAMSRAR